MRINLVLDWRGPDLRPGIDDIHLIHATIIFALQSSRQIKISGAVMLR